MPLLYPGCFCLCEQVAPLNTYMFLYVMVTDPYECIFLMPVHFCVCACQQVSLQVHASVCVVSIGVSTSACVP